MKIFCKCDLIISIIIDNMTNIINNNLAYYALVSPYVLCIWFPAFILCVYEIISLLKRKKSCLSLIIEILFYQWVWQQQLRKLGIIMFAT